MDHIRVYSYQHVSFGKVYFAFANINTFYHCFPVASLLGGIHGHADGEDKGDSSVIADCE